MAVRNSGYRFPRRRVTVNLAPAQSRKEGTHFDLPIALAALLASGQVSAGEWSAKCFFAGELALDELAEFSRESLEVLRQPLEDGRITVTRLQEVIENPARFMLIAASNPCPCGYRKHSVISHEGLCPCTVMDRAPLRLKSNGFTECLPVILRWHSEKPCYNQRKEQVGHPAIIQVGLLPLSDESQGHESQGLFTRRPDLGYTPGMVLFSGGMA